MHLTKYVQFFITFYSKILQTCVMKACALSNMNKHSHKSTQLPVKACIWINELSKSLGVLMKSVLFLGPQIVDIRLNVALAYVSPSQMQNMA